MRNYSAFQRTGDISREPTKRSGWLENFAEKLAVEEQAKREIEKPEKEVVKTARAPVTAVEVARQRQQDQTSVFEMMSSIINSQKPKYSSVEEAVKDYQQRTGLIQYLQTKAEDKVDLENVVQQIVQAGDLEDIKEDHEEHEEHEHHEEEEPEERLAKIVELFGREPDDDPSPGSGGGGTHPTLFEIPQEDDEEEEEWEEAATDDYGECAGRGPVELFTSAFRDLTEKKV